MLQNSSFREIGTNMKRNFLSFTSPKPTIDLDIKQKVFQQSLLNLEITHSFLSTSMGEVSLLY